MRGELDIEVFSNCELFRGVPREARERLFRQTRTVTRAYVGGEILLNQDDKISMMGILMTGVVHASKVHHDGTTQLLHVYEAGNIMGLEAVSSRPSTSPATLVSQTHAEVLWVNFEELLNRSFPKWNITQMILRNTLTLLADENIRLMYKNDAISKKTLEERVLTHLSLMRQKWNNDTVDIRMTQEEFAQYLCVSRGALSSCLNDLRRRGILEYKGSSYTVLTDMY